MSTAVRERPILFSIADWRPVSYNYANRGGCYEHPPRFDSPRLTICRGMARHDCARSYLAIRPIGYMDPRCCEADRGRARVLCLRTRRWPEAVRRLRPIPAEDIGVFRFRSQILRQDEESMPRLRFGREEAAISPRQAPGACSSTGVPEGEPRKALCLQQCLAETISGRRPRRDDRCIWWQMRVLRGSGTNLP